MVNLSGHMSTEVPGAAAGCSPTRVLKRPHSYAKDIDANRDVQEVDLDLPSPMDIDTAGPGAFSTHPAIDSAINPEPGSSPGNTRAAQTLRAAGVAADDPLMLVIRAPEGFASMGHRARPETGGARGDFALPPAGAGNDVVDDPGEKDVDLLEPQDEEYDDDITAVGGDIMGLGPTWGTVAGDPTSNLGGLGPQLGQQLLDTVQNPDPNTVGSHGGKEVVICEGPQPQQQQGGTLAAAAADGVQHGGGTVSDRGSVGYTNVHDSKERPTETLSEGDADIRGRKAAPVNEDADIPLRLQGVRGVGSAAAAGKADAASAVDLDADRTEGGATGPLDAGNEPDNEEYSPEGFDMLDPGAIAEGEFVSQPYLRHKSAGDAKRDPDPRLRPDPDAKRGLGLEGGTTNHPVDKGGDFGMGTIAVPALTDDAYAVRGLEYTDEPKYAPAVDDSAPDRFEALETARAAAAVVGGQGGDDVAESAAATTGGQGENGASAGPEIDDISRVGGTAAFEGSGPVLIQQVGTDRLQQGGLADATAAEPVAATDARHLEAIFGEDPFTPEADAS